MDYIFEKGEFDEDELEHAIIQLFEQEGYSYVYGYDIHRKLEDIILIDDLRTFICNKYSNANLTTTEINTIISKVINVGSSASLYAKNKEAYYLITEGFDFVREDSNEGLNQAELHVFMVLQELEKVHWPNIFLVCSQMYLKNISQIHILLLIICLEKLVVTVMII